MKVATGQIFLSASWVNSLKEKRMIIRSIIDKTKNKFNVSIAEIDYQDNHKIIAIGVACVSNEAKHANIMLSKVINFIENNTEAQVTDIVTEII